jgi:hypothetical protein
MVAIEDGFKCSYVVPDENVFSRPNGMYKLL